jgi:hypothetical protein
MEILEMTMHDLFGVVDDPVTEAAKMLAKHDLFIVQGHVMRDCIDVLRVLLCNAESTEEEILVQDLVSHLEHAVDYGMPSIFDSKEV